MKTSVLIVDDEMSMRVSLREFLTDAGYEVILAADANEALGLLTVRDLDVVLADILLPRITGVRLLEAIKVVSTRVQVILMTGDPSVETAAAAVRKGAFDYLTKPIEKEHLLRTVANAARVKFADDERDRLEVENRRYQKELERLVQERSAALLESEARYRAVVEDQTELICRFLPDSTITFVNRAYCEYFGQTPEGLLGRKFEPQIPEEDHAQVRGALEALTQGKEVVAHEHRVLDGHGQIRWMSWTNRVARDATGDFVEFQATGRDITDQRRTEIELTESHRNLRDLAERLQDAREEERKAVAQEIHDELGQALTGLRLDLSWLRERSTVGTEFRDRSESMIRVIDDTIDSVRSLSEHLRPPILDDLGAAAAIEWYAEGFARRSGIGCELALEPGLADLSPAQATAVFRITQEALTNVARHAEADHVEIRLGSTERELTLRVADNGRGIDNRQASRNGALGLLGMRERAAALGGSLRVEQMPQGGTEVMLRLPIETEESPAAAP